MKSFACHVLNEYKTLIFKMSNNMMPNVEEKLIARVSNNFNMLIDVKVLLFSYIDAFLECNALFNQVFTILRCFICNFLQIVKVCQT